MVYSKLYTIMWGRWIAAEAKTVIASANTGIAWYRQFTEFLRNCICWGGLPSAYLVYV